MQLTQAALWMDLPAFGGLNRHFSGVAVDSRLLKIGDLFFALPGAKVDGHAFLAEAAARGAAGAVVNLNYKGPSFGLPLLRAENPLEKLQLLATKKLSQFEPKIIAITGSLGKTTTKTFLGTLLSEKYRVGVSPGNSNSQIGLPLTILNHFQGNEEILVLEMGMTHPGQIRKLINIAPPDISILTTVALVHAVNFDTIEDIARSKAEIFLQPKTTLGILPLNVTAFEEISRWGSCKKISFGMDRIAADFKLQTLENQLTIFFENQKVFLPKPSFPGKHHLHNLLAAVVAAHKVGLEWDLIRTAIPKLTLPERRFQPVEKNGVLFINDAYNAAPLSVKAALESLPKPNKNGRKIAVFGGMAELGTFSEESHREVGREALKYVDMVLCFGPECAPIWECWQQENRPVFWLNSLEETVKTLKQLIQSDDIVLLKGSRSKQVERVLELIES